MECLSHFIPTVYADNNKVILNMLVDANTFTTGNPAFKCSPPHN